MHDIKLEKVIIFRAVASNFSRWMITKDKLFSVDKLLKCLQ